MWLAIHGLLIGPQNRGIINTDVMVKLHPAPGVLVESEGPRGADLEWRRRFPGHHRLPAGGGFAEADFQPHVARQRATVGGDGPVAVPEDAANRVVQVGQLVVWPTALVASMSR